ncbi:hypothetical protein ACVWZZ_003432 [Bradyrhizobium sp. LM6.10]
MAEIVVLYKTPTDPAAFDKYYAETHIPLAKKLPGLKKYAISKGPVGSPRRTVRNPSGRHSHLRQRGRHPGGIRQPGRQGDRR